MSKINNDLKISKGFSLIELVTVMILLGVVSVVLFSRVGSASTAPMQSGRDDLIAALFFAQQTAMARSGVQLVVTANSVSVTENGAPIVIDSKGYPLSFASGVSVTPKTFIYDKLGRTTAGTITLSAPGGISASVVVEASGYAH